jgi:hypothetical protein
MMFLNYIGVFQCLKQKKISHKAVFSRNGKGGMGPLGFWHVLVKGILFELFFLNILSQTPTVCAFIFQ